MENKTINLVLSLLNDIKPFVKRALATNKELGPGYNPDVYKKLLYVEILLKDLIHKD